MVDGCFHGLRLDSATDLGIGIERNVWRPCVASEQAFYELRALDRKVDLRNLEVQLPPPVVEVDAALHLFGEAPDVRHVTADLSMCETEIPTLCKEQRLIVLSGVLVQRD